MRTEHSPRPRTKGESPADRHAAARVRDALRRLSRACSPGWLTCEGATPRYRVWLRAVVEEAGGPVLVLDAPAEVPSELTTATICLRDGRREILLSGGLSRPDTSGARFVVRPGARFVDRRTPRLEPRPHAATVAFEQAGSSRARLCFPVLEIDAQTLRFDASCRFATGTVLDELVVSIDDRDVRRGRGVVTGVSAAVEATGRHRFHCDVRLEKADETSARGDHACAVSPERLVSELYWAMCDLGQSLVVSHGSLRVRVRLRSGDGSRSALPLMRCDAAELPTGAVVRAQCEMFGSAFLFDAAVVSSLDEEMALQPASTLQESAPRRRPRFPLPAGAPVSVHFRHPVDGARVSVLLSEIGWGGWSFKCADAGARFWPGLPLANVRVRIGSAAYALRATTVRGVEGDRVGVRCAFPAGAAGERLRRAVLELAHAPSRLHDPGELDDLLDLHRTCGLLEPEMERYLVNNQVAITHTWTRAHRFPDGLMRTVVVPWKDTLGASLTSVRAYERTWCLQHSSVSSPAVNTGAGILHAFLMALASARDDGEYIAGFVDAAARSLHGMVDSFMRRVDGEHRGGHPFVLYSAEESESGDTSKPLLRRLRQHDEALVEHVTRQMLDPVCANALSLHAGEIELPATRAAYRRIGLERGRVAWGAFSGSRCTGVLLQEYASPGLSLSGLLSGAMFFPLAAMRAAEEELWTALCHLARVLRLPGLSRVRFLFASAHVPESPIRAAGFVPIGRCSLFAFHRLSLEAYHRHVSHRYGSLRGRLERRNRREP